MKRRAGLAAVAAAMLAGIAARADEPGLATFDVKADNFVLSLAPNGEKVSNITLQPLPDHKFQLNIDVLKEGRRDDKLSRSIVLGATNEGSISLQCTTKGEAGAKAGRSLRIEADSLSLELGSDLDKLRVWGRGNARITTKKASDQPNPGQQ